MRACRARWLSRDNAQAAYSSALTNSRQIQHWADDLDHRLAQHQRGAGARLVEVITQAGIGFRVARLSPGASRARERSLKNSGGAARRCPICKQERQAHRHDRQQQPPRAGAVPTRGVRPGQARAFMALNPGFARPVSVSLAEKWGGCAAARRSKPSRLG
jgi:hypothetical protein